MTQTTQVDRAAIEAKVAEIEEALRGDVERTKPPLIATGIVVSLLVLAVAYFFGRRVGTKRSAIVEVKRI
ncbi:MAG: hypothetical protein DYH08_04940 [Actinobacteria bacterium ATB1]|nr:hypothetical protein [Actinobacteria bacterium ATB1]